MQNIRVTRYSPSAAGYAGAIAPEDGAWTIFIDTDGEASLWRRGEVKTLDGHTESTMVNVEAPVSRRLGDWTGVG